MKVKPQIVFFDMDHTLIDNDCDVSWKEFLIAEGLADAREIDDVNRYFDLYRQGRLPIIEFVKFQLRQFAGRTLAEMQPLARRHFERHVAHRIYPQARAEVTKAHEQNIPTAILTSTNSIIAEPLAEYLGMTHLIATELETDADGRFTGGIVEPYCSDQGKIVKAGACLKECGFALERAVYFGDSMSDVPMLEQVGEAVTVNPGKQLEDVARERGWRIVRWSIERWSLQDAVRQ